MIVMTPEAGDVEIEAAAPEPPETAETPDDGAVSRINFRLPEHLKTRIEQAAGPPQGGQGPRRHRRGSASSASRPPAC